MKPQPMFALLILAACDSEPQEPAVAELAELRAAVPLTQPDPIPCLVIEVAADTDLHFTWQEHSTSLSARQVLEGPGFTTLMPRETVEERCAMVGGFTTDNFGPTGARHLSSEYRSILVPAELLPEGGSVFARVISPETFGTQTSATFILTATDSSSVTELHLEEDILPALEALETTP